MSELLMLRRFEPSDDTVLFELIDRNRPWLTKFWWQERTRTIADSEEFIASALADEEYSGRITRGAKGDHSVAHYELVKATGQ